MSIIIMTNDTISWPQKLLFNVKPCALDLAISHENSKLRPHIYQKKALKMKPLILNYNVNYNIT